MLRITGYVCLIPVLASAASLTGTIYDPSGAVVPNAAIALMGAANQTAAASEAGRFSFQLSPGAYQLEVRSPGFAVFRSDVRVEADRVLPVFLRLGMVTENLEVNAQSPAGVTSHEGVPVRIRVGGNVAPVKLLSVPRPAYPSSAKARGVQGLVTFHCTIQKDGSLTNITPAADVDALLVEAAMTAVREWRYQPALLNGQPVETEALISVNYRLN